MIQKFLRLSLGSVLAVLFASNAWGYYSTMDTAELLDIGRFQTSLEPQVVTGDKTLMNFTGRFDAGIGENSSIRALLGTGSYLPLEWGLFYKWAPIPDLEDQPGIALMGGILMARQNEKNVFNFRFHPIVSKRFSGENGALTPFVSIPVGIQVIDSETKYPVQAALGAEFRPHDYPEWSAMVEGGFNISEAFNYISLAITYQFDGTPTSAK